MTHGTLAFSTLAHALRERGRHQPDGWAYTFLLDGETAEHKITYGELDARARAVARLLIAEGARGQPVLLLYPPGLEYIAAFFGCLYAGAIAVPGYPPDPARLVRSLSRLQNIIADSGARIALTTAGMLAMAPAVMAHAPELREVRWLTADALTPLAPDGDDHEPGADDLAFLQYTSGSTSMPKGTMVSHGNIIANQRMIAHGFGSDAR